MSDNKFADDQTCSSTARRRKVLKYPVKYFYFDCGFVQKSAPTISVSNS